ncbi:MAG: serine/threonine protein kinase [bacterium]|nr:serine/threonine protein kinase [bacterium]
MIYCRGLKVTPVDLWADLRHFDQGGCCRMTVATYLDRTCRVRCIMNRHHHDDPRRSEVLAIDRRRFHAARAIFTNALALAPKAREAFVRDSCGDDQLLLAEAMGLLICHVDEADPVDAAVRWDPPVPVPEAIGPYRVLGELGRGGMGTIYLAQRQSADGTPDDPAAPLVALKVLRTTSLSGQAERRFQREIEVQQRLNHPGIARLLDAGTTDGMPWLVTEHIKGVLLGRWRVDANPSPTERVRLLADLCEAVHAAHAQGVVHRDLKPENIMVTPDGQPKVLDFGIARLHDESASSAAHPTQTWQLLGTIRYMSPEQAAGGAAAIDERTDIYTLGVIAYELLTGALPYDLARLATPRALLEITTAEPLALAACDPALSLIVGHALEKDPTQRYATAAAMADDLRRYLDGRPLTVRPPSPLVRLRRRMRLRPRWRRAVLVAAILASFTPVLVALVAVNRATAPSWDEVFSVLEEAEVQRRSSPGDGTSVIAAIALFDRARADLPRLPAAPYAGDVERYIKLRLGELYYVLGELNHDTPLMEKALDYWRNTSYVPWRQGGALEIDPRHAVRAEIVRYGRHTPWVGIGIAYAGLADLRAPATNLALAVKNERLAIELMGDGTQSFHEGADLAPDFRNRHSAVLFNYGSMLCAYGAAVDSLAVIDQGLEQLRAAVFTGSARESAGFSALLERKGLAFLHRADFLNGAAAASSLDSAQIYLERAAATRSVADQRSYWQVHRELSATAEARADLAPDPAGRRQCLLVAIRELEKSLVALQAGRDDVERALTHADLAGVWARLGSLADDRTIFARADSLLALDSALERPIHLPLQHSERELRKGQVRRLRWNLTGDIADSAAAAAAFGEARESVPAFELPSLHRRIRDQEALLAARR